MVGGPRHAQTMSIDMAWFAEAHLAPTLKIQKVRGLQLHLMISDDFWMFHII